MRMLLHCYQVESADKSKVAYYVRQRSVAEIWQGYR